MDYYVSASPQHKTKEKAKARALRASNWWKNQLNTGLCYYCQESFPKEVLTMDHKVPISRGGMSSKSNIVICCKDCNTKKKNLTPVELANT